MILCLIKRKYMESRIVEFLNKISNKLLSSDYKNLYSKEGIINLLKGYGYPLKDNDVNDNNWEKFYNILVLDNI